jgi:hypothetical protein
MKRRHFTASVLACVAPIQSIATSPLSKPKQLAEMMLPLVDLECWISSANFAFQVGPEGTYLPDVQEAISLVSAKLNVKEIVCAGSKPIPYIGVSFAREEDLKQDWIPGNWKAICRRSHEWCIQWLRVGYPIVANKLDFRSPRMTQHSINHFDINLTEVPASNIPKHKFAHIHFSTGTRVRASSTPDHSPG